MTLEEYKKKVEDYLRNSGEMEETINYSMKIYEDDIVYAYKNNWEVESIALPMALGY